MNSTNSRAAFQAWFTREYPTLDIVQADGKIFAAWQAAHAQHDQMLESLKQALEASRDPAVERILMGALAAADRNE